MQASRRNFVIYSKDIRHGKSKQTTSAPKVKKYTSIHLPTVDTSAERESSEHTHMATYTHHTHTIQAHKTAKEHLFFGRRILFIQNYYEIVNKKQFLCIFWLPLKLAIAKNTDTHNLGKKTKFHLATNVNDENTRIQ